MKIIIFQNLTNLQRFCADCILSEVKANPFAKIGFATGVSPLLAYKFIVEDHKLNQTSWMNVTTFNLDEFVGIDQNHPEAFIKQMQTNLFNHLNLNPKNIHIPNASALDPIKEAQRYEQLIVQKGPIDLQYISLGVNGHMAYNEPNTPFDSSTHVATLTPETIADMVNKKKFASVQACPQQAITMGIQTILKHAKKVIMVAFGAHKASMTKAMIEAKPNNLVTASYLQLHKDCVFILDAAAASLLTPTTLENAIRV